MKTGAASKDVNGWSIVAKWLNINNKRQSDLASLLNITASAVSQIKNGQILLNAKQINLILDYLNIDSVDMCNLYTRIFNARLNTKAGRKGRYSPRLIVNVETFNNETDFSVISEVNDNPSEYDDSFRRVPLMTFKQSLAYEPALESIESYARYCSDQTVLFPRKQVGSFALMVDKENATPEFSSPAVLQVAGNEYPEPGDMVVAKLRTGQLITKYFVRKDNVIHLESRSTAGENYTWNYQDDPGYVQWMFPIIEANLKLRAEEFSIN